MPVVVLVSSDDDVLLSSLDELVLVLLVTGR